MKQRFIIVILVLLHFACQKEQSSQLRPVTPYEQWKSFNLHNYSIDQVRSCFCVYGGEIIRIVVRSDTVASVERLSDSTIVSAPASSWYFTIDSLFGIIQNSKADSLVIIYNAQYGFPEKLDINPQFHPVDGGVLYETSNLHIK